jgi:hypothetical protein
MADLGERWQVGGWGAMAGRLAWRLGASAATAALMAAAAWAQAPAPVPVAGPVPVPASGPAPMLESHRRPGPIRRALHHVGFTLHDQFIGYPDQFIEPPVGFYLNETLHVMKAKADPHRFFLYRSDFLAGTDRLSPTGATRFNQMAGRLPGWLGPLLIEWTPDQPGLDRARRSAVLAALQQAGVPVGAERVAVAPSPYPGTLGADAANYYDVMISRDQAAPSGFSLSPTVSVISGSGGGGGGGGGTP